MDDKYISVKDFSKLAGVSPQNIYKQLATRLQPYVYREGKRVYLDKTALSEVYGLSDQTTKPPTFQPVTNQLATQKQPNQGAENTPDPVIEILKNELKEKNNQIEKLSNLLEDTQKLLDQEQRLHLAAVKLLEEKNQETEQKTENQPTKKHWWSFRNS